MKFPRAVDGRRVSLQVTHSSNKYEGAVFWLTRYIKLPPSVCNPPPPKKNTGSYPDILGWVLGELQTPRDKRDDDNDNDDMSDDVKQASGLTD